MGQLVSDVTKVLDYKESKKDAENQRQQILAQMAQDEATKTNLIKKVWQPSVQNMAQPAILGLVFQNAQC